MAAKKTPEKPSKSDFIRELPKDMSVADVIAKGKEAGIKFTSSLVYMVRGRQDGKTSPKKVAKGTGSKKKKTGAKQTSSKKAPRKKLSTASEKTSSTKPGETKADFVRARAHLSPKEVVEDAKAHRIKLDTGYVYNVRAYDRATANKKARASQKTTPKMVSTKPTTTSQKSVKPMTTNRTGASGSSVEALLLAAASELGLGRALEILQGERARVRAVLGG